MLRPLRLLQCQLTRSTKFSLVAGLERELGVWGWHFLTCRMFYWLLARSRRTRHDSLIFLETGTVVVGKAAIRLRRGLYEGSHGLNRRRHTGLDPAGMMWETKGLRRSRLR